VADRNQVPASAAADRDRQPAGRRNHPGRLLVAARSAGGGRPRLDGCVPRPADPYPRG